MTRSTTSDYHEYPKTLPPDDFWGQVRRTVNGRPVPSEQIGLIVATVRDRLGLGLDDDLLDVACGNGALTNLLAPACRSVAGVDHSEYLVEVAHRNFEDPPRVTFALGDAAEHAEHEPDPERFTKVLCYGSFSFFPEETALQWLAALARRFTRVERVLLGNLPDRDRAPAFYGDRAGWQAELRDPGAPIGIWRSADEVRDLAAACGWRARLSLMSPRYYARHYRFDAVLERATC
jgi:SAM-dependent methyltransferase